MAARTDLGAEGAEESAMQGEGHSKKAEKKKMKKSSLLINLTHCRYDSVRRVARRCGLQPVVGESDDWTVYWVDTSVMMDRTMKMKRYQKINHFPGMAEICRKDLLGRNLTRMKKLFPKEYNIFPLTWVMPADYSDFQAFCRQKKYKTFISKPESGCQGKGIVIFKNPKDIKPGGHCVVQQYMSRPFIIDGFKFDYRVYVLVTSCDPLRVYVYKDGLGRFATVPYHQPTQRNLDKACLHLTNYSINKTSDYFVCDDISGSKRRISTVDQWFVDNGYDIKKIWAGIEDVIIKTLVSAHPVLKHNYRSCFPTHYHGSACFEILGFDVLLDNKLKAWIIEVNHCPSFHTDSPLDKEVKEGFLYDTLQLIDLRATDKRQCLEEDKHRLQQRLLNRHKSREQSIQEDEELERERYSAHLQAYEKRHMGGFRRVYPLEGSDDPYAKFFEQSSSLCAETAASKARIQLARTQRQEIEQRTKEEERLRNKLSGRGLERRCGEEGEGEEEGGRPTILHRRTPFRPTNTPAMKAFHQQPVEKSIVGTVKEEEEGGGEGEEEGEKEEVKEEGEREEVVPQPINEGEEQERLAGLQLRDRLVRGLELPQTLTTLLSSPQPPPPLHTSLLAPHTTLLPRRHISTHQPTPLPHAMSAGRQRLPSHSLHNRPTRAPVATFGLLVSAVPVAKRLPTTTHNLHLPPHHTGYRPPQPSASYWEQQQQYRMSY